MKVMLILIILLIIIILMKILIWNNVSIIININE